ncbi:MAG: DUF3786 domain-containing protein [Dehalococcoidia bacterium]|nr:DUF3786 domain-containing protein [Dehalococcoidia bacterium]
MSPGARRQWADGEEQAWDRLGLAAPADVCSRAGASYDDRSGAYSLKVFSAAITVNPGQREISGSGALSDMLLGGLSSYSRLSILWYLAQAQDIPDSGILKNPRDLPGGLIFSRGSHALPLERLASEYGHDGAAFVSRGVSLGGKPCDYHDASVKLYPFPRVPVLLVLRLRSYEFHAEALLLLDSTCRHHLPMDVVWSTAMMSVLVML